MWNSSSESAEVVSDVRMAETEAVEEVELLETIDRRNIVYRSRISKIVEKKKEVISSEECA